MQRQTKNQSALFMLAMLASRLILFLFFQTLIALIASSWDTSEKQWILTATLTNIVSIILLYLLFRKDGQRYLDIFRFSRSEFKKDILVFIGLALISLPVVFVPGYFISKLIWIDPTVPTEKMFGPIENWLVYILLIAFPVTIAFAELATYFGYIMPRLRKQMKAKWPAVFLPVLFLSIQHCTLPFIPDISFIIYRALVFFPFAILIGVSIYYRPSLFPYFAILHGLLDFGTAYMLLMEIK